MFWLVFIGEKPVFWYMESENQEDSALATVFQKMLSILDHVIVEGVLSCYWILTVSKTPGNRTLRIISYNC